MVDEVGGLASMQWENGMDGPHSRRAAVYLEKGLTGFLEASGGHAR